MAREVVLFQSLFKSNKWIWLFGWAFHVALALVLLRHLRYFLQPVPAVVGARAALRRCSSASPWSAALAALFARRFLVAARPLHQPASDYLMLGLLLAIGAQRADAERVARTDIVALKAFFLGLMRFDLAARCRPTRLCSSIWRWWRR